MVNVVSVQKPSMTCLLDAALQLSQSCRPQHGLTAAYLLRLLLHLPSFRDVLHARVMAQSLVLPHDAAAAAAAADDDDDDDAYHQCVVLLLQLLHRQLEVATVSLLQVSELLLSTVCETDEQLSTTLYCRSNKRWWWQWIIGYCISLTRLQ